MPNENVMPNENAVSSANPHVREHANLPASPLHFIDPDLRIPVGNATLNLFYVNYESARPGWFYGLHSHSSYELHYVPSGYGTLRVGAEKYRIVPGTLYLTGPGVYHEQTADERAPMEEYCLNFEILRAKRRIRKEEPVPHAEVERLLRQIGQTTFWFGSVEDSFGLLFLELMKELRRPSLGSHLVSQNLACTLIIRAFRRFAQGEAGSGAANEASASDAHDAGYEWPRKNLKDARRFIVDNAFRDAAEGLAPAELAERIGVSRRQLERILREYYGMTFSEKVSASRIERARDLLAGTDIPVRAVAEASGFASAEYFSRVFKRHTGLPPAAYRAAHRKQRRPD